MYLILICHVPQMLILHRIDHIGRSCRTGITISLVAEHDYLLLDNVDCYLKEVINIMEHPLALSNNTSAKR